MPSLNQKILSAKVQEFISEHVNSNLSELVLKGLPFPNELTLDIINQIEAKKSCKKKLNTWFTNNNIYYPTKLNIEQTSSETTAKFKASLVSGESLIDITGGFGVDDFYFSKQINQITHCEINSSLSEIVRHNNKALKLTNINCIAGNGIEILKQINTPFNWVYIDPSRRHDAKGKVFMLKDCEPNVVKFSGLFFKYAKHVMIKTSPILDISAGLEELQHVKTIYSVAINNEVKELIWILERNYNNDVTIKTIHIKNTKTESFNFLLKQEPLTEASYSQPLNYIYEPNAAILKAGAFNQVAVQYKLSKLQKHSHLYTSENLIDFPGRCFKIIAKGLYQKKQFKRDFKLTKANVTTRNFPESVDKIRKKLNLKDGGTDYLFFTTDLNGKKIVIHTIKV